MSGTATPLSLNEIGFYFTRAAVGAGAPFGIGEDFARACMGLAYLGLDPAVAAAPALRGLATGESSPAISLRGTRDSVQVRCRAAGLVLSALYAGPVVVDRLSIAAARDEEHRLFLDTVDQPMLIVGAVASADLGTARIEVCWPVRNGGQGAVALDHETAMIGGLDKADMAAPAPAAVEMVLNRSAPPMQSRKTTTRRLGDGKAHAIEHGVVVDSDAWPAVLGFFRRCLVPSTGQSRAAGAGGGELTDND